MWVIWIVKNYFSKKTKKEKKEKALKLSLYSANIVIAATNILYRKAYEF